MKLSMICGILIAQLFLGCAYADSKANVGFRFEEASRKASVSYLVNEHIAVGAGALYSEAPDETSKSKGGYALFLIKENLYRRAFYLTELDVGYLTVENKEGAKLGSVMVDLSLGLGMKEGFTETSFGVVLKSSRAREGGGDSKNRRGVGVSPFMAFSINL